jgi:hypothetical protein
MTKVYIVLLLCFIFMIVFPIVGFAGPQYIYSELIGGLQCDANSLLPLRLWLKITASISLGLLIPQLIVFTQATYKRSLNYGKILLFLSIVFSVFNLVWNIIGCVSFFNETSYEVCKIVKYELWLIMWVSLAMQWWLLLAIAFCTGVLLYILKDE